MSERNFSKALARRVEAARRLLASAVIAGEDFAAHTGHLFRGVVTVTCEVHVITDPDAMRRVRRPDLGFNPLEPA